MIDNVKDTFAVHCTIALMSCAIGFAPVFAAMAHAEEERSTTTDTKATTDTHKHKGGHKRQSNEDYVADLKGLTDDERAELKQLLDKQDAFWEAVDPNNGLTDDEAARMEELYEISWKAELSQKLTEDELKEFNALHEKLKSTQEDADLTDDEWRRMRELEDKAYGAKDGKPGDDACAKGSEDQSSADFVATLPGLSDAEKTELAGLIDKQDAYWVVLEAEHGLTDTEQDRLEELEDKAMRAQLQENLSADEYQELEAIWAKIKSNGEGVDLTDDEQNRMFELEAKGFGWDKDQKPGHKPGKGHGHKQGKKAGQAESTTTSEEKQSA